jgi:hypothetical protein
MGCSGGESGSASAKTPVIRSEIFAKWLNIEAIVRSRVGDGFGLIGIGSWGLMFTVGDGASDTTSKPSGPILIVSHLEWLKE